MNSHSASWISRNQALVWACVAAAIIVIVLAYYAGRRSASGAGAVQADSVLVERVRQESVADTASLRRIKAKKAAGREERAVRRPVSRDFLDEEVSGE